MIVMKYFDEIMDRIRHLGLKEGEECIDCPRKNERNCANIECLWALNKRIEEKRNESNTCD